jgi:hypothetical protein
MGRAGSSFFLMLTLGYEPGYNLFEIVFAVHVLLFSQANKIKGCALCVSYGYCSC